MNLDFDKFPHKVLLGYLTIDYILQGESTTAKNHRRTFILLCSRSLHFIVTLFALYIIRLLATLLQLMVSVVSGKV